MRCCGLHGCPPPPKKFIYSYVKILTSDVMALGDRALGHEGEALR